MKRTKKYKLMSGVLASILLISSWKNIPLKVNASTLNINSAHTDTTVTQSTTQDEFLSEIDNNQVKKFYTRLYELYDYESFNSRSIIPQYFQTIYGDKFSCGTIQSAGCGISSLAMVSSYLFDEIITPDMMTIYDNGPSPASAFEKGIRRLNLNCEIHRGQAAIDNLDQALDNGHPVIALIGKASIFTDYGHFIVLAGKTPEGKYIVNDPNIENYYQPHLIDGFTNGFTKEQVTRGLNGIYIFDTKEQFLDNRDTKLSLTSKQNSLPPETNPKGIINTDTELRTGTTSSHSIIKRLDINTEVTRIYTSSNGWDLVKTNNYIGYINQHSVSYSKENQETKSNLFKYLDIAISLEEIELKKLPSINSETISNIPKGTELEVIAITEDEWLVVKINNNIGYIPKNKTISLLERANELYPELKLTQLTYSKIAYVTTNTNLRCGNSIEFDSIDTLEKYETVRVIEEFKDWYFVLTNENNLGFIPKKYTKLIEDKSIVADKSEQTIYYYDDNQLVYSTEYTADNSNSKAGIYPVLSTRNNFLILNPQSNWKNSYNKSQNHILQKIYKEMNQGDSVIIHK